MSEPRGHPISTVTSWRRPSSSSEIVPSPRSTPSTVTRETSAPFPVLATRIAYTADPWRYSSENSRQDRGTHGSIVSVSPCLVKPRRVSSPMRYIHDAEPVYHVQPPRPRWPAAV